MPYLGNIPPTQYTELKYQDFTGGTGTSFTLNDPVGSAQELEVFVNNVRQEPGVAYTANGTALTMTGSIVATDDFYVVFQGKAIGTVTHPADQALTATDGTFTGNLDVSSGTIKLDGNYPTGSNNVALGDAALDDGSLSGGNNTAVGNAALGANTSGAGNSAIGGNALFSNTTGANNTAVGLNSLVSNTTAANNVAVGQAALYANTTGTANTAVGSYALDANTTADNNTALGYTALTANTTGDQNVAVGSLSLEACTTGSQNVAVGYDAGDAITTGSQNTLIGRHSGGGLTTATYNAFLGRASGSAVTTGSKNTIIGSFNGNQDGVDIRTASNNIVLSDGDGNARFWKNNNSTTEECYYDNGGTYVREVKHTIRTSSNFSNPTVNLLTKSGSPSQYAQLIAKVIVQQTPWDTSTMANQHEGTAIYGNAGSVKQVSSMSRKNSTSSSTSNVGTLSWSGNTLRYTANRASNYDGYYISIEVSSNGVPFSFD